MPTFDGPLVAKVGSIVRQDPELRFSAAGKPFAKFSISVKPYVPKGQEQPEAVFYDVTAFGTLAEHVAMCLHKGNRVIVLGTGQVETWDDKNTGEKRSKKVILADAVGPDLRFVGMDLHGEREKPAPQAKPAPLEYAEDEEPF